MTCPNCGHKQMCPCKSCAHLKPDRPWVWVDGTDGYLIACGACGLTKSVDWWGDRSMNDTEKVSEP
jgi:transcription elongation factor Elf1